MKPAAPEILIEVDALRVGMFVHLEGGWISHPFALSNFRLVSDEQVMAIRSLGVKQVRWSPHQSDATLVASMNEAPTPSLGHPDRPTTAVSISAGPGSQPDMATGNLPTVPTGGTGVTGATEATLR